MTMLVVDHLAKTYGSAETGVEAIREISFDVREREFVCIVGPSGGGKTTLLRCINLLEQYDEGSIRIDGVEVGYRDGEGVARTRRSERERPGQRDRRHPAP